MAGQEKSTRRGGGREAFEREAGRLYEQMMGRSGGTDTFDEIEGQGEAAGRALILKLLQDRLKAEAQAQASESRCPTCGKPMRRMKKAAQRHLQTMSGTVAYERPHAQCDRCGASFSPSGQTAQHPAPGGPPPGSSARCARRTGPARSSRPRG